MEIIYFDCIESTQKYLVKLVKAKKIKKNTAIIAKEQSKGVGSRNNQWSSKSGDIIVSFAIKKDDLPKDLPISSASIYFAYLMKELLNNLKQKCWLKWPNDIYIKNKKCAGVITQLVKGYYIVGIGVNLTPRDDNFINCNIEQSVNFILNSYFTLLKNSPKWQEVLSKYRVEFEKKRDFFVTINGSKVPIGSATLCKDGALLIENERIYSLR